MTCKSTKNVTFSSKGSFSLKNWTFGTVWKSVLILPTFASYLENVNVFLLRCFLGFLMMSTSFIFSLQKSTEKWQNSGRIEKLRLYFHHWTQCSITYRIIGHGCPIFLPLRETTEESAKRRHLWQYWAKRGAARLS